MPTSSRLSLIFKAIHQLGWQKTSLYTRYQLGLRTGCYRRLTDPKQFIEISGDQLTLNRKLLSVPSKSDLLGVTGFSFDDLISEADEIVAGKAHLFGGPATTLDLRRESTHHHWTAYETGKINPDIEDIKLLWEPARFGWVFTLGRAFIVTQEERYPQAFWRYLDQFTTAHPPYDGPQWMSAQEVAFRIIALTFAAQVFADSESFSGGRPIQLACAIASHAERISPTLPYARAQNNNHLLLEAAGLYTASKGLPLHPHASQWRETGWTWCNQSIQDQISADGTYVQHSVNYHRLMLQASLWIYMLAEELPLATLERLRAATNWLLPLIDPHTGLCPNLGPNDGSLLFPLSNCQYSDYRPVCQAASLAFIKQPAFLPGPWDELAIWLAGGNTADLKISSSHEKSLNLQDANEESQRGSRSRSPHFILNSPEHSTWAYLRAVEFRDRPGHADQLHIDLWWQGVNLARDAGTFSYNQLSPWNNSFARTQSHNTITVNNSDQMTHAGKFLWLDWAQARLVPQETDSSGHLIRVTAEHDGYRRFGITHRRIVQLQGNQWEITDSLLPARESHDDLKPTSDKDNRLIVSLFWHLPDFPWELKQSNETGLTTVSLKAPSGLTIELQVQPKDTDPFNNNIGIQLIRAGILLAGSGIADPTLGWFSPTYNIKEPSLSLVYQITAPPPVTIISRWQLA